MWNIKADQVDMEAACALALYRLPTFELGAAAWLSAAPPRPATRDTFNLRALSACDDTDTNRYSLSAPSLLQPYCLSIR